MPDVTNQLYYETIASQVKTANDSNVEEELGKRALTGHTHKAADVTTDDEHQFVTKDIMNQIKTGALYTNETPTISAHGGIPAGTTFKGKTVQEMFDAILYPYVAPTVSASMTYTPSGTTQETGTTVSVSAITVNVTKKSASITKVEIFDGSTSLGSKTEGVANGGAFTFSFSSAPKTFTANKYYTAKVTDSTGKVTTANTQAVSFVRPFYYGVTAKTKTTLTSAEITALSKSVSAKSEKTFAFTAADQKMVIAYPQSYGALKKITDPNNFDITSTFEQETVAVTGKDGTAVNYYLYIQAASATVSGFNVKFTF